VLFGGVGYAHATDYYVDTSTIPAGDIRGTDGYCSLAEAIASANAGANRHGCRGVGSGSEQRIILRQASGKSFATHPYNIGYPYSSLSINSAGRVVSIQSEGGRAQIRFTSGSSISNAFVIHTLAAFWSVDLTHTGSTMGRLIFIHPTAAVNVFNSTLSGGNVSGFSNGYGGAIHNLGTLDLGFGTQLRNNTAVKGGAVYNKDGTINVSDVTLEDNSATGAGGGIYNLSSTTLPGDLRGRALISGTGMKIWSNSAPAGGGVFNRGSRVVLSGPEIRENTTSGSGSQETCHSGTSCDGNGAGVLNINTSTIRAYFEPTGAVISDNSASGRGGGVYVGGEVTLYNSTVSGNSALTGGALYVINDTPGRYCEVVAKDGGWAVIEYNEATAGWGFSVLDGDGALGTTGAHCKFYNLSGGFIDRGHDDPKCETDRFTESNTSVCQ
jgi:predicted outer membrane repeat protein